MSKIVILIGEPRTGKTLNCEAIKKAYGCRHSLDGVSSLSLRSQYGGYPVFELAKSGLLIINTIHPKDPRDMRRKLPGQVISVADAKKKVGTEWIEPKKGGE